MHSIAARIESQLTRVEQRFGLWVAAGLVAALLLVVACTYVTPAIYSINHGRHYEYMSVNPFDFARRIKVQSRPLTPVLAWLLFLRGSHYILLPLAVGTALLAVVYGFFRRRDWRPLDAVGMAALLAFSTPLLHVIHFAGYTDTTSYLLLMLMMMAIARPWLVAVLAALALLNHESNLFAFPGLVLFTSCTTADKADLG